MPYAYWFGAGLIIAALVLLIMSVIDRRTRK
jgi:hypothetical protein